MAMVVGSAMLTAVSVAMVTDSRSAQDEEVDPHDEQAERDGEGAPDQPQKR